MTLAPTRSIDPAIDSAERFVRKMRAEITKVQTETHGARPLLSQR